jgi:hypothetical protein
MADSVIWAPMTGWPAAFVPKCWQGLREWTKDGPSEAPISLNAAVSRASLGRVYQWQGSGPRARLVCVNCPDAAR